MAETHTLDTAARLLLRRVGVDDTAINDALSTLQPTGIPILVIVKTPTAVLHIPLRDITNELIQAALETSQPETGEPAQTPHTRVPLTMQRVTTQTQGGETVELVVIYRG